MTAEHTLGRAERGGSVRLQMSRRAGADLQKLSRETNGLPAKVVARPTAFGNPWTIADAREAGYGGSDATLATWCSALYREWIEGDPRSMTRMLDGGDGEKRAAAIRARLPSLRGHNLACWCALPAPGEPDHCHAAVLLDLANRPVCEAVLDTEPPASGAGQKTRRHV